MLKYFFILFIIIFITKTYANNKEKIINSIDIYADSLNENKDKLPRIFSEFIFGFVHDPTF